MLTRDTHKYAPTTAATRGGQEKPLAHSMLEWLIHTHFPHLIPPTPTAEALAARDQAFFREVIVRTARLVAEWQLVGFTHGVLNTDNSASRPGAA